MVWNVNASNSQCEASMYRIINKIVMKRILLAFCFLSFHFLPLNLNAQNDTVFVDQNDSSYLVIPGGYRIVDTVDVVAYSSGYFSSSSSRYNCPHSSANFTGIPDSSFYIYWLVQVNAGLANGSFYFYSDSVLLDSIHIDTTTNAIQVTDTFQVSHTITSNRCNNNGSIGLSLFSGYFHVRTEIRISPITTDIMTYEDPKINSLVYPNPVQSILSISGAKHIYKSAVEVYDLNGRMVMKNRLKENKLNVSELESGMYFLTILEEQKRIKFQKL